MKKKLWIAGLALALAVLGGALVLPSGRMIFARAVIAVGSKDSKMWVFRQVEDLGGDAGPAVADLILAPDFMPLSADGKSLESTEDELEVLEWVVKRGGRCPELNDALILLVADRLEGQHGTEARRELRPRGEFMAETLLPIFSRATMSGRPILKALRSENPRRRAAGLLVMICKRATTSGYGRPIEQPAAEVRETLSRIASTDSDPVNARDALFLLSQDGSFETRPAVVERFLEAAAAAVAGPLRESAPEDILKIYPGGMVDPPNVRVWREILRPRLGDDRRGVAIQAAVILARFRVHEEAELCRALLRAFEPEGTPTERLMALKALVTIKAPAAEVVPAVLGAVSLKELQGGRELWSMGPAARESRGAALLLEYDTTLRNYANRSAAVFRELQAEGNGELRAKAALYAPRKGRR